MSKPKHSAVPASAPVADERAAFEASYRERYRVPAHAPLTYPDVAAAWEWWQRRAALASAPVAGEAQAEQFIQAAIDQAPEPLRRLGEYLSRVLDEDQWATAERMLLGACNAAPQASEAKPYFSQCVFHGPAPEGFADWYQWLEAPVKMGAFIRAATADDWKRSEDASQDSQAQCSCPSGDGSLRHPCAVHGGDHFRGVTKMVGASEAVRDALAELVRLQNLKDSKNHQPNPQRSDEWAEYRRLWPTAMEKARAALSAQPGAQKGSRDAD